MRMLVSGVFSSWLTVDIFPQNHIDRTAKSIEQQDRVQTDPEKKNDDWTEPKKDSPLHNADPVKYGQGKKVVLPKSESQDRHGSGPGGSSIGLLLHRAF